MTVTFTSEEIELPILPLYALLRITDPFYLVDS